MHQLLRIRPRPGQSRPDFLLELAELNRLRGISELCRVLRTDYITLATLPLPMLSAALRGRLKLQRNATSRHHRQLRRLGLETHKRMCPLCSKDGLLAKSHFSRPLELLCRQHDVLLIDCCPNCDNEITNKQNFSGICEICLCSLSSGSAVATPDWVHSFLRLFSPKVFWEGSPAILEVEYATAQLLLWQRTPGKLLQPWLGKGDLPMIKEVINDWPDAYLKAVQHALESGNSTLVESHLAGGSSAAAQFLAIVGADLSNHKRHKTQYQQRLQASYPKIQKIVVAACSRKAHRSQRKIILPLESSFYKLLCTGFIYRPENVMLRATPLELAEELIAISDELRAIACRKAPCRPTTNISTLLRLSHRRPISKCPPGCEACTRVPQNSSATRAGMHEALGCWVAAFVKSILLGDTVCYGTGSQRGLFDGLSIPKSVVHVFFGPLKAACKVSH